MGCHALTVLTGVTVQDSAGIEDSEDLSAEWIDDQARSLLEDMPVRAFKVGGVFSPEAVSAIAEILADYSAIPVILHLGSDPPETMDAETEDSAEEMMGAMLELLVPQATVVVVDALRLRQLVSDDVINTGGTDETGVQALLSLGATWVLTTGLHVSGDTVINTLTGGGDTLTPPVDYRWERLPGKFRGAGNTLSAALSAMVAGGMEISDAAAEAQEYTWRALSAGFQPGMGRLLPDRFFWARQPDRDGPAAADAAPGAAPNVGGGTA